MKRLPLITSFVLFIALCVSAAYWAMQFLKPPVRAIAAPPQVDRPAPPMDAAAGLLGGRPSAVVASNFQLKGVVVAANPAESVAILSANGKPAVAIRCNREILPGVTVKEVQGDHVMLSENGVIKRVELSASAKSQMKVTSYSPSQPPPLPRGNLQYGPGTSGPPQIQNVP